MNLPNSTNPKLQKAFTLIEMLIVISIIGVLAVSLISFINPQKQFEKGNNAAIRTSMAKILTAIESYYSVKGEYPDCAQFPEEIENEIALTCSGTPVASPSEIQADFTISSIEYPELCDALGYYNDTPASITDCKIRYEANLTDDSFCLGVMLHDSQTPTYLLFQRGTGVTSSNGWADNVGLVSGDPTGQCNVIP